MESLSSKTVQYSEDDIQELIAENKKLKRSVDELSMLNDLAFSISAKRDSKEIMHTIINRSICIIGARQGNITLVDETTNESGKLVVRSTCSTEEHAALSPGKKILTWIREHQEPLFINDLQEHPSFYNSEWNESIDSVLAVPLLVRSRLFGVLTIYNKKDENGFTDEDHRLLSIIASQTAQVIENAQLQEKQKNLQEIRKDINVAAKIQKQLLPNKSPDIVAYDVSGKTYPAQTIGGDFYDFIQLGDHKWVITLGDVSGKGLPASLLMSNIQAHLRGKIPCTFSPGKLLQSANDHLFEHSEINKFATLFIGVLDTHTNTISYSNGGHEFPFLIKSENNFRRLKTGGIPIGMIKNQEYKEETLKLDPGDKLVAYTDGVTDSRDNKNKWFGEEQLQKVISDNQHKQGKDLLECIFKASADHSGSGHQFDDRSAIVVDRNK